MTSRTAADSPETVSAEGTADYDHFAAAYADQNDNGLFNAWYGRPEILRLAGDVTGQRVLDAGCGHGPLLRELRARGAHVSGFDLNPAMIALAREQLGDDIDLRVADLADPLPYPDGEFDLIVISLALHYVRTGGPRCASCDRCCDLAAASSWPSSTPSFTPSATRTRTTSP